MRVGRYTAGLLQQTQALSRTPFSFRVQLQMGPPIMCALARVNEKKVNGGEYAELEIVFCGRPRGPSVPAG